MMQHGLHWKLYLIHNSLSSRSRDALLYAKCSLGDGGTSISMPTRKRNRSKFRNAFFEKNMSSACNEMRRWKCFVALVKCENNQTLESICLSFSRTKNIKNNVLPLCQFHFKKNIYDVFTSAVSGPTRCPCTWHDPKFVKQVDFRPPTSPRSENTATHSFRVRNMVRQGFFQSIPTGGLPHFIFTKFRTIFFPSLRQNIDLGLVHAQLAVQHQNKPSGSPLRRKSMQPVKVRCVLIRYPLVI